MTYEQAYQHLNTAQRQAVDTIEGPVLVIAGPGTGKTQLLTTRIAHILATTDTLPENILCLTFTDSAAQTMRERLTTMIGQDAYDITIHTYHAFGAELIRRFPDYFVELNDTRPVDDLGIDSIFRDILASLPYSNPLRFSEIYLPDIKTFVSDAKRALLTPQDIHRIAKHNQHFIDSVQPVVGELLDGLKRIDKTAFDRFAQLRRALGGRAEDTKTPHPNIIPLATLLLDQLDEAIAAAKESGKTTPLTVWKNTWLAKDEEGRFIIDGRKTSQKLAAAADIYQRYLEELTARGLYDYDDMILRAVHALEQHPDLRYTLQERYLYILLDEFQDTNGAQLRLVDLLTDNPVHEGRPNVLAVGDDDQAIYAFQGANYSHMLEFQRLYRDVRVITLTENYRSHQHILDLAQRVAGQITERISANKPLTAATTPNRVIVQRREAKSDIAQFAWTARKIKQLIDDGLPASDIAVLAPKHKHLEPLVAFLHQQQIPVRYEKRENVLDDPAINQLVRMSELILQLAAGNKNAADALWPEVLSYPFWNLPTSSIWGLSWQANDSRRDWTEALAQHPELRPIVLFFARLSMIASSENVETMLDHLIGVTPVELKEPDLPSFSSPFYEHYFGALSPASDRDFWNLLTNLTVLRARLRHYRASEDAPLHLTDFIQFVQAHRAADIKILNTSPYQESEQAVQLMTTYKAKGQEFGAVFVLAVNDEVWGNKARAQGNRLSLPPNLQFIRYAGATSDERLRLFYVAITRAKSHLYLVNYTANYAGKTMTRLKYLSEAGEDGTVASPLLPDGSQEVLPVEDNEGVTAGQLAAFWQQRHAAALGDRQLRTLLQKRLEHFRLSPTHVNSFIDLEKQGPTYFFTNTILRFPQAPTPTGEYGSAIHEILEWIHRFYKQHDAAPTLSQTVEQFARRLRTKALSTQDAEHFLERGTAALTAYLQQRLHTLAAANESERNFSNEGVFVGAAHLGGKIDKLIVDHAKKTVSIVDFKTGSSQKTWTKSTKLHRYRQQLYLYKTLVERSHSFKRYRVVDAYIEFIEPDEQGNIQELHVSFDDAEQRHAELLAERIWQRIQNLDFPDVSMYGKDVKGIEQFENDLLEQ